MGAEDHTSFCENIWKKCSVCFYRVMYYSVIKKDKPEVFIGKWTQVEAILLSDINQTTCVNIVSLV